jgi:1-acyl-sn-glycerol-3-phosphate acyltransferase
VNRTDVAWLVGRPAIGTLVRIVAPFRTYGAERVPRAGGLVLALNHFSWLDPWVIGATVPRTMYYLAKSEVHATPLVGPFVRLFGTFSVRRGESDREAVRMMRGIVRRGDTLGLFAEGTRQRSGVPGPVQPGAAMVAIQEAVPVVCAALRGTHEWRVGNFHRIGVAFGQPIRFDSLPRNSRGYREASATIETELRRLWEWLGRADALGRPRFAVPPA